MRHPARPECEKAAAVKWSLSLNFRKCAAAPKVKAAKACENLQSLTAEDLANTVERVANRYAHVTINYLVMMPQCQSFGGQVVKPDGD